MPYPTPPPSSGIMHELPPLPPWEQDEEQLDEQEGEREREQQYFETIDCSNRQHLPPDAYGAISQYVCRIVVHLEEIFKKHPQPKRGHSLCTDCLEYIWPTFTHSRLKSCILGFYYWSCFLWVGNLNLEAGNFETCENKPLSSPNSIIP